MAEIPANAALLVDRAEPVGSSLGSDNRRRLHVRVSNTSAEALPVYVTNPIDTGFLVKTAYAEALSVASSVPTEIATFVVPAGKIWFLDRIEYSGTNIAEFWFTIDGNVEGKKRTYFGGQLSDAFDFTSSNEQGLRLNETQEIKIFVQHFRPFPGDFNIRLQYVEGAA